MNWMILLSRALMAAIFIESGIGKALAPSETMAGFAHLHVAVPGAAYAVALLVEIGGGIAFLIGWKARCAALVLAIWCIVTALVAHYHPEDRGQMINFMKNLCMAGGFLQVVAYGAGRFSVDRK
jgi:putative oxidoreductase